MKVYVSVVVSLLLVSCNKPKKSSDSLLFLIQGSETPAATSSTSLASEVVNNPSTPSIASPATEPTNSTSSAGTETSSNSSSGSSSPSSGSSTTVVAKNRIVGTGRDPIVGTASDDRILGGPGAKTITTGAGRDEIVYQSIRDVGHTIEDFTVGEDKIVVTELLRSNDITNYRGGNPFASGHLRIIQGTSATSSILQVDRDGSTGSAIFRNFLSVNRVRPIDLDQLENFIFQEESSLATYLLKPVSEKKYVIAVSLLGASLILVVFGSCLKRWQNLRKESL